jgi:hypothetical protein
MRLLCNRVTNVVKVACRQVPDRQVPALRGGDCIVQPYVTRVHFRVRTYVRCVCVAQCTYRCNDATATPHLLLPNSLFSSPLFRFTFPYFPYSFVLYLSASLNSLLSLFLFLRVLSCRPNLSLLLFCLLSCVLFSLRTSARLVFKLLFISPPLLLP